MGVSAGVISVRIFARHFLRVPLIATILIN